MGVDAVLALMEAAPTTPPVVIGIDGNQIIRIPLMEAVQKVIFWLHNIKITTVSPEFGIVAWQKHESYAVQLIALSGVKNSVTTLCEYCSSVWWVHRLRWILARESTHVIGAADQQNRCCELAISLQSACRRNSLSCWINWSTLSRAVSMHHLRSVCFLVRVRFHAQCMCFGAFVDQGHSGRCRTRRLSWSCWTPRPVRVLL